MICTRSALFSTFSWVSNNNLPCLSLSHFVRYPEVENALYWFPFLEHKSPACFVYAVLANAFKSAVTDSRPVRRTKCRSNSDTARRPTGPRQVISASLWLFLSKTKHRSLLYFTHVDTVAQGVNNTAGPLPFCPKSFSEIWRSFVVFRLVPHWGSGVRVGAPRCRDQPRPHTRSLRHQSGCAQHTKLQSSYQ